MSGTTEIRTLFLDIGGVLLTNGWDRRSRQAAVEKFDLDFDEIDERHHLTYDTYEEGKLSLDEYLDRVIFHEERSFTHADFKAFMFEQSQPCDEMLEFTRELVRRHNLQAVAISNEGKELTEYRIRQFELSGIFSAFVSSCFVHYRKPDVDIYRIALDIAQARPEESFYIDDRPMFIEVARSLGIRGIVHDKFDTTRNKLAECGLTL